MVGAHVARIEGRKCIAFLNSDCKIASFLFIVASRFESLQARESHVTVLVRTEAWLVVRGTQSRFFRSMVGSNSTLVVIAGSLLPTRQCRSDTDPIAMASRSHDSSTDGNGCDAVLEPAAKVLTV